MYTVLGYEEAVNTCDCCGKTNLKGTFGVERDDGEILYFGSVCVTRHTGKAVKVVRKEAKDATELRRQAAAAEYRASSAFVACRAKLRLRTMPEFPQEGLSAKPAALSRMQTMMHFV